MGFFSLTLDLSPLSILYILQGFLVIRAPPTTFRGSIFWSHVYVFYEMEIQSLDHTYEFVYIYCKLRDFQLLKHLFGIMPCGLTRYSVQFSSVQSLSCVRLFATPWIAARQASLSITNSRSSRRLKSIKSVMPSSHLILCRPLLLLPPIPPSQHQGLFQWVSSSHEVAKVLQFQL